MRRDTCSCSAPVQLQLRLVGFCLRLGPAAPWALARQCRAVVYGTADPATSPISTPVVATSSSRCTTIHGAAQAFRRTMTIGVVKSVGFEKKMLDLKLVYKKKC